MRSKFFRASARPLLSTLFCMVGMLTLISPSHASEQNYPTKPIRLIVAYPPGGSADAVARLVANKMQENLGRNIIVENRTGASQTIGTDAVSKAAPDGYTIGLISDSHVINPYFIKELPYDSLKDFRAISHVATFAMMLVANPGLNVKSVQEFVELAKSRPGALSYASTGNGTPHQLSMEWLKFKAGIDLLHVPYRGAAPAMTDVVGGQVNVMFGSVASVAPFVATGKAFPIAVSSRERQPAFPEVPTLMESGFPEYDWSSWFGIAAPAGTPDTVVKRLNEAVAYAVGQKEVKETLLALSMIGVRCL